MSQTSEEWPNLPANAKARADVSVPGPVPQSDAFCARAQAASDPTLQASPKPLPRTLSWSAANGTSPFGYTVCVFQVIPVQNGLELLVAGNYSTAQTSMTLPPLTAGNTYIFVIITEVDGVANIQTSPYRSQLPTAFATVMSAQVAISAGASGPQLRGDPKELKRFLQPKGKRYRMMASHE